jgi:CDP-diacylglycerol--glycerol-3-phosphate 3-phosphatidyltransferase
MNLPNKLTLGRLFATPVFMAFVLHDNFYSQTAALLVFIAAGVTDLVDGHLARKHNLITPLGVFLDPLADKLIITGAFIAFVEVRALHVPAWMVVAIVGREFLITGLRGVAATHGVSLAADDGGKFKTAVQNTAIITILVTTMSRAALAEFAGLTVDGLAARGAWAAATGRLLELIPFWMMFGATLASVHTGVRYLVRHAHLLRERP